MRWQLHFPSNLWEMWTDLPEGRNIIEAPNREEERDGDTVSTQKYVLGIRTFFTLNPDYVFQNVICFLIWLFARISRET